MIEVNRGMAMYNDHQIYFTLKYEFGSKIMDVNKIDQLNLIYRGFQLAERDDSTQVKLISSLFMNTPVFS